MNFDILKVRMKQYNLNIEALLPTELRNLYIASLQNKLSKGECSCGRTCICKKAKDQGVKLGQR
jgi:hypothetical protein